MGIGKDGKPLHEDARPIVVGETFRRVAAKLALLTDKASLGEWLRPHQLAVGTAAGVEAVVHGLRQWRGRNKGNNKTVLLKGDYENAFNEADPSKFLESGGGICQGARDWPNGATDRRLTWFTMGESVSQVGANRDVR